METLKIVLGVLGIAAVCYAQVPAFGKCPNVTVVDNLDVGRYLGDWYEVTKFFFFIERGETCIKANYSLKDDGHIQVLNKGLKADGSLDEAVGDAYPENSKVPAKLSVSFNGSPRVPYWIVDTDYDNYSLVWSCSDLVGVIQTDFAWILSRNRTLPQSTVEMLMKKLGGFGVKTSNFQKTVQDGCTF